MLNRNQPVTLILAATSPALGIGKNGSLPWRLPKEMKFFKQVTDGSTVVMGRKTWESIPPKFRPLTNRINVIVSRNHQFDPESANVVKATSIEEALRLADKSRPIFVIGGAQIYSASLKYADRVLLTLVEDPAGDIECDTFFKFDNQVWKEQGSKRLRDLYGEKAELPENPDEPISEKGFQYKFTVWEKEI